jgi:hypothetical protein
VLLGLRTSAAASRLVITNPSQVHDGAVVDLAPDHYAQRAHGRRARSRNSSRSAGVAWTRAQKGSHRRRDGRPFAYAPSRIGITYTTRRSALEARRLPGERAASPVAPWPSRLLVQVEPVVAALLPQWSAGTRYCRRARRERDGIIVSLTGKSPPDSFNENAAV